MKVSHYKDLLKCTFGDEPSVECFVETLYDILFRLSSNNKEHFRSLSVYQLFQLLTELRVQAFGNECVVQVTKDETKCSLYLDLLNVTKEVKEVIDPFEESFIEEDNIRVNFGTPTVSRLIDKPEEDYICFIKSITAKGKTILVEDNDSARILIDKLSPRFVLKVIDHCSKFAKDLTDLNLLAAYGITDQKLFFVPTVDNLLWYSKLYFSEPLDTFYENLFFLAHHGKIDASYIETCTPGEYIFLAKKLAATLKERNTSDEQLEH